MISQLDQNHLERQNAFEATLKHIESSKWKEALIKANKTFNIKPYNVEKLTPQKVRQLYKRINQRFYLCQRTKNGMWIENQLRLFIWILVVTSQINNKPIECYVSLILFKNNNEWQLYSKIFQGKSILTCKFQFKSIAQKKATPWNQQEEQFLTKIIEERNEINLNWNQISRDLFNLSVEKYFKTSKQCRQHWNNYLNPHVFKKNWEIQQDYLLMKYVLENDKKWSAISKVLNRRRTQHMVKNRFKSIILSNSKHKNVSKKHSQSLSVLQGIFKKIKTQFQKLQQDQFDQSKEISQKQKEILLVKSSKSAFQPVSTTPVSDSTVTGFGQSQSFGTYQHVNFQLPCHQTVFPFIFPYSMPMYCQPPANKVQTVFVQNYDSYNQGSQ